MTDYLQDVNPSSQQAMSDLERSLDAPCKGLVKISKDEIRSSLRASTLDGIFATLFSSVTGGVLISNFLVELDATPFQIGMLASMPMVANLLQPLGAYLSDRTLSRRRYGLWVYGLSRVLWLPLAIVILVSSRNPDQVQPMIVATLVAMLITHIMDALGSASWLSWLATLVPRRLRGRYFGFRNSAFSITGLVALPLLGVTISRWSGGSIQGYGVMIIVGVVAGLISLGFQSRMTDVNPQDYINLPEQDSEPVPFKLNSAEILNSLEGETAEYCLINQEKEASRLTEAIVQSEANCTNAADLPKATTQSLFHKLFRDSYYGLFLFYFGLWAFGINLSGPFFNLYLLDNLALDLSWVTLYNGLGAGANLLMLIWWGRLADRIGNRSILLLDGLLVAITPLLWLGTGANSHSIWLWFPLLHLLGGGTGAAIDLCINNLQFAIVPIRHQTKYFAITAAIGGVAGAMGALAGGWLAQSLTAGNMTALFALSSILRLIALLPLFWLQEPRRRSLSETLKNWSTQLRQNQIHFDNAQLLDSLNSDPAAASLAYSSMDCQPEEVKPS